MSDETVGVETKTEIKIEVWGVQWPEGQLYLMRELDLDK